MISHWSRSQKTWVLLLGITSTPPFLARLFDAGKTRDIIAYGVMFVVFTCLSFLGGWFLGKYVKWQPPKS